MFPKLAAFLIGLFTIAAQTALLREYLVFMRGSELSIGMFFGAWFSAIALSAGLTRKAPVALREAIEARAEVLLVSYPLVALAGLFSLWLTKAIVGVAPYEPVPASGMLLGALLCTWPTGLLTGATFPAVATRCHRDPAAGAAVGYAVESAGAVLGGIMATLAFVMGLSSVTLLGAMGALMVLPGLAAMAQSLAAKAALSLALLACVVVAWPGGPLVEGFARARLRANLSHASIERELNTPYQLLTVSDARGQTVLLSDGAIQATLPTPVDVAAQAAFLAVQPAHQRLAVVLGQGGAQLSTALCRYFKEVVLALRDPVAASALREVAAVESCVRLRVEDPRQFVAQLRRPADLVVVASGEPRTLIANRMYTLDFFDQVRRHLDSRGVAAAVVWSEENFLGTELLRYGQSVFVTMAAAISPPRVAPGERAILVASPTVGQATSDPQEAMRRYRSIARRPYPYPPEGFLTMLPPDRVAFIEKAYSSAPYPQQLLNSDARPLSPFLFLVAMMRRSDTPGTKLLYGVFMNGSAVLAGLLGILLLGALRVRLKSHYNGKTVVAATLISIVGGASITATILLMALYQSRIGTLYSKVGLLVALTMGGLAIGAQTGRRIPGTRAASAGYTLTGMLCFAALAWFETGLRQMPPHLAELAFMALLAAFGALTGAGWSLAARLAPESRVAWLLELADHAGAAAMSFGVGFALFALFGFRGANLFVSGMFACVLAVLGLDAWLERVPNWPWLRQLQATSFGRPVLSSVMFCLVAGACLLWNVAYTQQERWAIAMTRDQVEELDPLQRAEPKDRPFPHFVLSGTDSRGQRVRAVAALSQAIDEAKGIKGYGGPLNIAISMGKEGTIRKLRVLQHNETPSYVTGLPQMLSDLEGRKLDEDAYSLSPQAMDAMTGATVTRKAVSATLQAARRVLAERLFGLKVRAGTHESSIWDRLLDPAVFYAIVAILLLIPVHQFAGKRLRLAYLLANLLLGGVVFNVQLSTNWLLLLAKGQFPSLWGHPALFFLSVGVLALSLVFGPIYCAHLCPFGAAQEIASRLSSRLRLAYPLQISRFARGTKYVLLVVVVVGVFTVAGTNAFDPLVAVFSDHPYGPALLVAILGLAGSLFFFRFYCRVFCPLGAFFLVFNRLAMLLRLVPGRAYRRCDLEVRGALDTECLQCNRCIRELKAMRVQGEGDSG